MNITNKVIAATVIIVAVISIVGVVLLYFAQQNYEVVAKGQLLAYTPGLIYEIRFGDAFNIYLEPERRPDSDLISFYFLIGIGFNSLTFFTILGFGKTLVRKRILWLYFLTFLGMNYLAFDEYFGIHESLGHNLQFLAMLPLVKRPDDAIVLFYLIPCILYSFFFYKEFLACKKAIWTGTIAIGLIVFAAISDLLTIPGEEIFEILAGMSLFASFLFLGLHHSVHQNTKP